MRHGIGFSTSVYTHAEQRQDPCPTRSWSLFRFNVYLVRAQSIQIELRRTSGRWEDAGDISTSPSRRGYAVESRKINQLESKRGACTLPVAVRTYFDLALSLRGMLRT